MPPRELASAEIVAMRMAELDDLSEVDSQEGDEIVFEDGIAEDASFAFSKDLPLPSKELDVTASMTEALEGTSVIYFSSEEEESFNSDAPVETSTLAKELKLLDQQHNSMKLLPPVSNLNSMVLSNMLSDASVLTANDSMSVSTTATPHPFNGSPAKRSPPRNRTKQSSHPTLSFCFDSIPEDVVLSGNGNEAVQFTGDVGVASRSLIARRALPKPKRILEEDPANDYRDVTTKSLEPFVMPFMIHGNAKRSFLPRLVSYFEATIIKGSDDDKEDDTAAPTEVSVDEVLKELERTAESLDAATEEVLNADDLQAANTFDTNPDATEKTTVDEACIAIGVVSEHHRTDILPGWGKGNGRNPTKSGNGVLSYGLHSDDGSAWANRAQLKGFVSSIAAGDTIGCGIDYRTNTVFYTVNGQFVGHAHALPNDDTAHTCDFYPALGVDSPDAVECNFGLHQPFKFDLVEYCQQEPPAFNKPTPTKVWKSPQDLKEDAARELRAKQLKALAAKKSKRRFSLKRMFSSKKNKRTSSMKAQ